MSNKQRVTELLKKAYNDELETIMNYLANSIYLEGVRAEEIKEELNEDLSEELAHAEELGKRLKQLGETPPSSFGFEPTQDSLQLNDDPTDVRSVIDGVIEAEQEAIDLYRELVNTADDAGDPVTEDIAVGILRDEESHLNLFKGFLREYEN